MIFLSQLPDYRQSVRAGVDVGYIKDALNIVGILGIKSIDRFAALTNPEIALVPLTHGCTGDGVRSLRSNQQRTMEVILVKGCNCTQQLHPVFRSSAGALEHILRHLMQLICTNSHNHSPHFIYNIAMIYWPASVIRQPMASGGARAILMYFCPLCLSLYSPYRTIIASKLTSKAIAVCQKPK